MNHECPSTDRPARATGNSFTLPREPDVSTPAGISTIRFRRPAQGTLAHPHIESALNILKRSIRPTQRCVGIGSCLPRSNPGVLRQRASYETVSGEDNGGLPI